jgi:hypothetical protein
MRSSRVVAAYESKAFRAAVTARSTSASLPRAISVIGFSVAGLMTSRVSVPIGSTHWPSM